MNRCALATGVETAWSRRVGLPAKWRGAAGFLGQGNSPQPGLGKPDHARYARGWRPLDSRGTRFGVDGEGHRGPAHDLAAGARQTALRNPADVGALQGGAGIL